MAVLLNGTPPAKLPALLRHRAVRPVAVAAALGELVVDKLPSTPARTAGPGPRAPHRSRRSFRRPAGPKRRSANRGVRCRGCRSRRRRRVRRHGCSRSSGRTAAPSGGCPRRRPRCGDARRRRAPPHSERTSGRFGGIRTRPTGLNLVSTPRASSPAPSERTPAALSPPFEDRPYPGGVRTNFGPSRGTRSQERRCDVPSVPTAVCGLLSHGVDEEATTWAWWKGRSWSPEGSWWWWWSEGALLAVF